MDFQLATGVFYTPGFVAHFPEFNALLWLNPV